MAAYEFVKPPLFLALFGQPVHKPLLASTLANFPTDKAEPAIEHKNWLVSEVGTLIKSRPGCWVDLIGHASRIGDAAHNLDLSKRRVQRVEDTIRSVAPRFETFKRFPKGESESGSIERDDSARYRSVEVLVYGPEIPKPAPQPTTEERVTFRETIEKGLITKEPNEPGLGDGKSGALIKLYNVAKDIPSERKRLAQHPYETGDIERGTVKTERKQQIQKEYILIKVNIEKVIVHHDITVHIGYYEITWDTTRSYTFIWGPGSANQQVAVTRHLKVVTDKGRVDTDNTDTFFVKQPPNLMDP
jgi:hypothetical protein